MLVLTRRPLQSIVLNDNIRITIRAMSSDFVQVAIESPGDVTACLEENRAAIVQTRRAAAGMQPLDEEAFRAADAAVFRTPTYLRHPDSRVDQAAGPENASAILPPPDPSFWG